MTTQDANHEIPLSADPGHEAPDATLVHRVLNGDRASFERLVLRHQANLFRRARWMGFDADTAADMVQDALLKAYANLRSCRDPNRFASWTGQILRNTCLDFLKSAARRGAPLPLSLPADGGNPEVEEQRRTLRSRLREALSSLPDEHREAFLMKHAEDLSYDEMSELTGASVSALKMRVHRAREMLRAQLNMFATSTRI